MIELAFTYVVPEKRVRSILNTIYAIFLGFLFNSLFKLEFNETCGNLALDFLIMRENGVPLCLLFLYFIFDWLTFNLTVRGGVNHLILVLLIVMVIYLGALVIFAFVPSMALYLSFGIYLFIVSWWDLALIGLLHVARGEVARYLLGCGMFLIRVCLGSYILCYYAFTAYLGLGYEDKVFIIAIIAVFVVKFIRYLIFVACRGVDKEE